MTILDQIAAHARERVFRDMEKYSLEEVKSLASQAPSSGGEAFYQAVGKPGISFICEIKKASPSKGLIDPEFDYMKAAADYAAAGAEAISCLTESKWFLGSDEIFREIRSAVRIPMLRKDFVVDEYQLYQAKVLGADCVLLICALLDTQTIHHWLKICEDLGLAALVETHDEEEIRSAVEAGARMIGVNNRNLKDFSVDVGNSLRLRSLIPEETLFVAESGVQTPGDIQRLREHGVSAVLIGEHMMRAADKTAMLAYLKGEKQ